MEKTVIGYDPEKDIYNILSDESSEEPTCSYNGCELLSSFLDEGVFDDDNDDPELILQRIKDRKVRILELEIEALKLKEKIEILDTLNIQKEIRRKHLITERNNIWLKRQTIT